MGHPVPTAQAGRGNYTNSYLQNLANNGTPNSVQSTSVTVTICYTVTQKGPSNASYTKNRLLQCTMTLLTIATTVTVCNQG